MLLPLMWKHMKARYRQYFRTITEIVFPIIIFCVFFGVEEIFRNVSIKTVRVIHSSIKNMTFPEQVIYYPETDVTDKLMNLVGPKVNLTRIFSLTENTSTGYIGINNLFPIKNHFDNISSRAAIVIFRGAPNFTTSSLKEKLNYTIRMKSNFQLRYHPNKGKFLYESVETLHEEFLTLQWAIDTSYLDLLNSGVGAIENISFEPLKKKGNENILLILHIFSFLGVYVIFMFHVARVMVERISGTQALLHMGGVSYALFNISHFLNAMMFSLIYTFVVLGFLKLSHILELSNIFLVALMVIMYYANTIAMGFLACYLLSDTRHVLSSAAGLFGLSYLPSLFLFKVAFSGPYMLLLTGIIPHVPIDWFWAHLVYLETYGEGLNTKTIMEFTTANFLPPYVAYVMTLAQFMTYSAVTYYFSLFKPGSFRTGLPWDFTFNLGWYGTKPKANDIELLAELHGPSDKYKHYFEVRPPRRHVGIRMANISKIFKNSIALHKINLNVYRGEIMVVVGQNGSGKSTLMNIIAGIEMPSTGTVYVNGLDVASNRNRIKKFTGVCPQQEIFIPELTVIEHIIFFIMIRKKGNFTNARYSAIHILRKLNLELNAKERINQLTLGQKRRLQLGCAIAGDTTVLILDEPTSGLGVHTRRGLWDVLYSLREDRTVIITTHYMEEADAFGDRVAALHIGRLRCDATPRHLKKAVGTGYRLTLMTIGTPKIRPILRQVLTEIPQASVREVTLNCITFNLPTSTRDNFPQLFESLEQRRDDLSIQSIGIGTITLEELILRLCSDVRVAFHKRDAEITNPNKPLAKGFSLYRKQFVALWQRQVQYAVAYKYSVLLLEFIVPVAMIIFLTYVTNATRSTRPGRRLSAFSLDLTTYNDRPNLTVLLHLDKTALRSFKSKLQNRYYSNVEFDVVPDVLRAANRHVNNLAPKSRNVLFGIDLKERKAKILYSSLDGNTAQVALNLLANLLAERSHPATKSPVIYTYNDPIPGKYEKQINDLDSSFIKTHGDIFNWALFVSVVIMATAMYSITPLANEHLNGTRHIYLMYGCSPVLYWLFTWLYHSIFHIVLLIIPTVVVTIIFEANNTLDQVEFRLALFTTMVIGLMAHLSLMYLFSLYAGENIIITVGCAVVFAFGMITPTLHSMLKYETECCSVFHYIIELIDYVIPPHTFTSNLIRALNLFRINALCKTLRRFCPDVKLPLTDQNFDVKTCCETKDNMKCYFCLEKDGLGERFVIGAVQSTFYMILVVLTQMGIFNGLWDRIVNRKYEFNSPIRISNPLVLREYNYVEKAMKRPPEQMTDVALVHNLCKRYQKLRESKIAVEGVSFSVKKGECFGLLGTAGAGKTTLLKMLVGAECVTRGSVVCNGISAKVGESKLFKRKFIRSLGYCPQNHILDDFRTGEQNLATLLKLRGYHDEDVTRISENWIYVVSLEKQSGRRLWYYNSGCARRLAAAAALMAGGALTALDEPTGGIDISAKRLMWFALSQGLRGERAAIVASDSMTEMVSLCDRVCILVDGRVTAVATPAELLAGLDRRNQVQLLLNPDVNVSTPDELRAIDSDIRQALRCTLVDGHRSMLQYQIAPKQTYATIFTAIEAIKSKHRAVLLDYTVKEPTLEELYLKLMAQGPQSGIKRPKSWFRYA